MLLSKTTDRFYDSNGTVVTSAKEQQVRLGTIFLSTIAIGAGLFVGYSVAGAIVGYATFKMILGF